MTSRHIGQSGCGCGGGGGIVSLLQLSRLFFCGSILLGLPAAGGGGGGGGAALGLVAVTVVLRWREGRRALCSSSSRSCRQTKLISWGLRRLE